MSKSSLVTNGKIKSMVANKAYKDGWDRIFGKKQLFDEHAKRVEEFKEACKSGEDTVNGD